MIKMYKEFLNEGIVDLLSGYSMEEVKEKLKHLTPIERYNQLNKLKLKYDDVYTQEEIDKFTGLDKILALNKYDFIYDFFNGIAKVELNDKFGIIDEKGKEITPIKYNWIHRFKSGISKVELNNKYGLIDQNGKEITPIKYDVIEYFHDGLARVKLNDKYGLIDENGKEIIPIKYDLIYNFFDNKAPIELNGKTGYIDKDGNEYWDKNKHLK